MYFCFGFIELKKSVDNEDDPLQNPVDNLDVDIGNNCLVPKSILNDIKSDYFDKAGTFLRKLMYKSGLFTLEEVAGCSVTGKAYLTGNQRPRLDLIKFAACKGNYFIVLVLL